MQNYRLIETILDEKWDKLVNNSDNGNIYNYSYYLNNIESNIKVFYCFKNKELRAGFISAYEDNNLVLNNLIIYSGIIYNKPTNKQNLSQKSSEQFQIQEFIFTEILYKYENITLNFHPSIIDIRPILWVNYGLSLDKYAVELRYTSYVNISDFKSKVKLEDIELYKNASVSRRQQIRYAVKKNYTLIESRDVDKFIKFYIMTFKRQNQNVNINYISKMGNIIRYLIENKKGILYASCDENNEIGSMAFFSWDNKRAYYMFGANDPNKRNTHTGTDILWKAFYKLQENGINEIDLEGINSPFRGWFKLSFGGNTIPYYRIKKVKK